MPVRPVRRVLVGENFGKVPVRDQKFGPAPVQDPEEPPAAARTADQSTVRGVRASCRGAVKLHANVSCVVVHGDGADHVTALSHLSPVVLEESRWVLLGDDVLRRACARLSGTKLLFLFGMKC